MSAKDSPRFGRDQPEGRAYLARMTSDRERRAARGPVKRALRRLESVARTLALTLLGGVVAIVRRVRGSSPPDVVRRVLVIRHDGIGDVLMTTGLLRAIAGTGALVDVLTQAKNVAALRGLGAVNEVLTFEPGRRGAYSLALAGLLRRRRYDAVVDAMIPRTVDGQRYHAAVKGNTALLLLLTGARRLVGAGARPHAFVYTHPVVIPADGRHHVERVGALARAFGLDPDALDLRPTVVIDAGERRDAERAWGTTAGEGRRILVNVSTAYEGRRWPIARYARVVMHLRERRPDARVLVVAAPADREWAAGAAVAGAGLTVPSLRGAMALVVTADLVVTPDTSLAHVASSVPVPTVGLLVRGNEEYVPYRTPGAAAFGAGPTLESLPVESVLAALDRAIEARPALRAEAGRGEV